MKLQEALREIIMKYGVGVLGEKRLVFLLSDFRAFDGYPAMRQVMSAIVSRYGKDLCRAAGAESGSDMRRLLGTIRTSLVSGMRFREDLADFASDCILYALGLVSSVREPVDHGFDPTVPGSGVEKDNGDDAVHEAQTGSGATDAPEQSVPEKGHLSTADTDSADRAPHGEVSEPHRDMSSGKGNPHSPERRHPWYTSSRALWIFAGLSVALASLQLAYPYIRYPIGAAHLGNTEAEYQLGNDYASGRGIERNPAEAVKWWRKAAEKGHAQAQHNLGVAYAGSGNANRDEAAKWFRKACESGLSESCEALKNIK